MYYLHCITVFVVCQLYMAIDTKCLTLYMMNDTNMIQHNVHLLRQILLGYILGRFSIDYYKVVAILVHV